VDLVGGTPLEGVDMSKFRDTLMINVMGSVLVSTVPMATVDAADMSVHGKSYRDHEPARTERRADHQ
jgi:hypothetical protein